jgi:hypothetical protein
VHNFDEPHRPRSLRLPAGVAVGFRKDMEQLVEETRPALTAALESEEYRTRRQVIEEPRVDIKVDYRTPLASV